MRADAGRDGRTCFAIPSSQARTRTVEKKKKLVQLTTSRLATLPGWSTRFSLSVENEQADEERDG